MKNVTYEMLTYREALRHLWNSTFSRLDKSLRFGTCLELFEEIDELIFQALVCEPFSIELEERGTLEPILKLKVVPIGLLTEMSLMVNRSTPASGYWDYPVRIFSTSGLEMALIGFFDWDEYNVKDCAYYRVRIVGCKSHPDIIGRDALVETHCADVFWIGE